MSAAMPEAPLSPGTVPAAGRAFQDRPMFWNAVLQVARKEFLQHLRTKRLLIIGSLMLCVLILITIVLPLSVQDLWRWLDPGVPIPNYILLLFLQGFLFLSGFFFLTLLPIVLTSDAVCSEWSHRTIFLLLSKPVSREAFVLGKFLGSAFTVGVTLVALLSLDYAVLHLLFPSGGMADVGRFVAALGILVLGVGAWAAVSLFFSSITRSTAVAMILTLSSWIIVFPILSSLDRIVALLRFGDRAFLPSEAEHGIGWSQYLSPGSSMASAANVLVNDPGTGNATTFLQAGDIDPVVACLALVAQTAFFLGLTLLVVRRRNFE